MTLTDTGQTDKPTDAHHNRTSDKKERPQTKVVVRRLPPTMDQASFLNQVSPVPDYDYIYSVKGDFSLGENAFSRVYINFLNLDDIFSFKERFDNYVFLDTKGNEYPAVVEFAAFQKIPKKRNKGKPDPKSGTIESDPYYLEFLESLKERPVSEEKPEFSLQLTSESKTDTTTPLLEFVKQRRIERQRIKEERREERKRKEMERRSRPKEENRKKFEEKSPTKSVSLKSNVSNKNKDKSNEEEGSIKEVEKSNLNEKPEPKGGEKVVYSSGYKRERKYEDRKSFASRNKYPSKTEKKEPYEKSEFKQKKSYEERKEKEKEDFKYNKKVKKYSERREERKNESKKSELKKVDEETESNLEKQEDKKPSGNNGPEIKKSNSQSEVKTESNKESSNVTECSKKGNTERVRNRDSDPRTQRRIRNKDRPTMAIYQPGALSKKKHTDGDGDAKDANSSTSNKEQEQ